jgi:methylmalonyl-CoA/ethylmalonyl-CoA epimerase
VTPPAGLEGRRLDHVAIAVASFADAAAYLQLGAVADGPDERVDGQGVVVRLLRWGDAALELLVPTTPTSPVARFLERRGPGLHHVAFAVDDLVAEVARLTAAGATFVDPVPRPGRGGSRVVFLHPRWTGGVLVELVAHGARPPAASDGDGEPNGP